MGLKVFFLACRMTGYKTVKRLLESEAHQIVGVVSSDYENMVNDGITCDDFAAILEKRGIPFWRTDKIHEPEFAKEIETISPDVGLSVGWRRLVKDPVVSAPRLGFFNFHTSDLPKYRGFASTSWAILNGDESTAITAHRMVSGRADEGDIYLKKSVPITASTDIGEMFKYIESVIPGMALEFLNGLESDCLKPTPQDSEETILSFPRKQSDGWIDWSKSANEIDRLVRSVSTPYPGAFTCWRMKKVVVWKGRPINPVPRFVGVPGHIIGSDDGLSVKVLTGDGMYLVELVQLENEGEAHPALFIKGVQERFGLTPGEMFETLKTIWEKK